MDARQILKDLFNAGLAASDPAGCLRDQLPEAGRGRLIVVGAGKAAAAMARAVEDSWPGPIEGLVVTRYGHGVPCRTIEVLEAAHPVPDEAGTLAARRILAQVSGLSETDQVLFLASGGGSALLAAPAEGVTLDAKQAITTALLKSGAAIDEINCVRKHLSAVKGGRLALAAWPARVLTLAISDVPGDDPAVIASGPTVADPTTCADALALLDRHRISVNSSLRDALASGELETPKPGDPRLAASEFRLIASPRQMLEAAAARARERGLQPLILGDALEGEARELGRALAGVALSCARYRDPAPAPCVLLSGGETTVTVRGGGRGGRNTEFLLGLALGLGGAPGIHALAADSDGIDGSEDNAGAFVAPNTLARARVAGLDPRAALDANDAWGFFAALGDLLVTGPTRTNVNDFRAILVGVE
ncbi:MAG: glycerate kinase [Betaproteobacteria bacterium]|jgi:hydroxypyruvate reductase|nr:glycerate kinase [Betaproteobacteria bacterium]HMV20231.1 glycerate kinase [Rhodocyclaceae bacterium]HNL21835.1 glycerate kinase [Rhodocyclaceae bacterium]HNM20992.1 glycerate kinase [Rhodocyclaceae bacterium]HNM79931.1 glycerate kinase [Rhodocyclaceae bacterium]